MYTSLKVKISLFITVILILSTGIISLVSLNAMIKAIDYEVAYGAKLANLAIAENIETFLRSQGEIIRNMSKTEEFMLLNEKKIHRLCLNVQNKSEFVWVYYANKKGKMYMAPDKALPDGFDPRSRDWYKKAVEKDGLVYTDPYIDVVTGLPCVSIAIPIKDSKGNLAGVLAADLSLKTLSEIAVKNKFGKTGYVYVTDSQGKVIGHPDPGKINLDLSKRDYVKNALAGKSGFDNYIDSKGIKKLVYYSKIPLNGWGLFIQQSEEEAYSKVKEVKQLVLFLTGIILLIFMGTGFFAAKRLVKVIRDIEKGADLIAKGDLSNTINNLRNDELGYLTKSVNRMSGELKNIIGHVKQSSVLVTATCENLAESMNQISESSTKTTEEITEVAASVEQISASAEEIAGTASEISSNARDGQAQITEVVKAMHEITISTNEVSKSISEVDRQAKEIGQIVHIISNIADQTNLLALNAAIEAARAGERGRGFTVVAEEVRQLAKKSADATKDIANLILSIQKSTGLSVDKIQTGNSLVEKGNVTAIKAGEMFNHIAYAIDNLSNQIEQTSQAIQHMSSNIQNIAAASEEQTAIVEEVNIAVEKVKQMAFELNDLVNKFTV